MRSFDSSEIRSFLRESVRLYVRYLSVGLSAIPAGLVYGICVAKGYDRWWVALLAIAVSLAVARTVWKYLDSRSLARSVSVAFASGNFAMDSVHTAALQYGVSNLIIFAESQGPFGPALTGAEAVQPKNEEAYAFADN